MESALPPSGQSSNSATEKPTAFYDGGCPVCRIEVAHYRRIGGEEVQWVDVCELSDTALSQAANGRTRDQLLGAMHVRDGSEWRIGVDAFPAIWQRMPGWKHFTWLFAVPGVRPVAGLAYRAFLAWQRWHRKRRNASV
jgi:predicted DCC family thiol-disulfide oxidoreductase YuxK